MCGSWSVTENFLSFWPFFALLPSWQPKKSKLWKNEKTTWRYYHFTPVQNKWPSYDVWFLRYQVQQTEFLVILDHFLPFYSPSNPKKSKFWKTEKNTWRYYHCVPQMTIIWCMVSEILSMTDRIFVIFDHLLPFYPPNNLRNQNFEKLKKTRYHHFTQVYLKSWLYAILFLRYDP